MIVLYGNELSTYCAKIRGALRYKDVAFEDRPPPDGYASDAYRRIVPMGTIPGFVDGDLILSESEAIAEYLEERYPRPALLHGDASQRARIRSLSRIHDCWVEPQLRALYAHANPARRDASVVAQRASEFHRRLAEFATYASPAPYIAGTDLSLADLAWATTLVQAELLFEALEAELTVPERLTEWRACISRHPALAPGVEPCATAMTAWLAEMGATADA